MKKHSNLSIFVPHAGCRHMCSFCDQRTISQTQGVPSAAEVIEICNKYLPQSGSGVEIAFFGGSFTAIDVNLQTSLLSAAYEFVKAGRAEGIRLSTRPDAISPDILKLLKKYGVTSIELGAQSMDDEILRLNMRGHTAKHVEQAADMIKQSGFSLGLQMMPGLYGADSYENEAKATLSSLLKLFPDTMRIYPAVVLQGTMLARLYQSGEYEPLSIEEAVKISAQLILMCEEAKAKVIRAGLAADSELEKAVLSGPYHPAFRELCESEIFRRLIEDKLSALNTGSYEIQVAAGALSAAKGHKKQNEAIFAQKGYNLSFLESGTLSKREFILNHKEVNG